MHIDALMEMEEAPPGDQTVRSALTSLKDFYIEKSRVAADWRQEARRLGGQANSAEGGRSKMERELAGTKRRLDTVTEERAKCGEQLQSWAKWYAHYRECCLLAPNERPMGTSEDCGSRAGMPYAESLGRVFRSSSFGGAPYSHRGGSERADVESEESKTVPLLPQKKP